VDVLPHCSCGSDIRGHQAPLLLGGTLVERLTHPVAGQQVPPDRYGSRARRRPRRWLRWCLYGLGLLAAVGAAVAGYSNLGSPPIEGKQTAFTVRDDHSLSVTVEVQRDDPRRAAECVVRARSESGDEVGRKEILIPPAGGTGRWETVLRTSARAVIGEVYGCSYNVPEYLSNPTRPTG
jgi:hypothetical protein